MAMARACWESTRHLERGGCRRAYVVPNRLVPQGKVNQLHAPPPVGQTAQGRCASSLTVKSRSNMFRAWRWSWRSNTKHFSCRWALLHYSALIRALPGRRKATNHRQWADIAQTRIQYSWPQQVRGQARMRPRPSSHTACLTGRGRLECEACASAHWNQAGTVNLLSTEPYAHQTVGGRGPPPHRVLSCRADG